MNGREDEIKRLWRCLESERNWEKCVCEDTLTQERARITQLTEQLDIANADRMEYKEVCVCVMCVMCV